MKAFLATLQGKIVISAVALLVATGIIVTVVIVNPFSQTGAKTNSGKDSSGDNVVSIPTGESGSSDSSSSDIISDIPNGGHNGSDSGNAVKNSSEKVVYMKETDEILHNPGMGWILLEEPLYEGRASLGWAGDFPEADTIGLSLSWGNVEKEDGVFDWSIMDRVINYWTAKGKHINLRLSTDTNTIGYPLTGAPNYIGDKYHVKYEEVQDYSTGRYLREYKISDPKFMELNRRFIKAFADHYKNNPYVDTVDLRGYGYWGEWHSSGLFDTEAERINTLNSIINLWKEAWGGKLLAVSASYEFDSKKALPSVVDSAIEDEFPKDILKQMQRFTNVSAFDTAFRSGITFRRDGIGGGMHKLDSKLLTDAFKSNNRLPILGEHFGGYDTYLGSTNGYNLDQLMGEALYKYHVNYMTAIGWVAQEFKKVTTSVTDGGSPDIVDLGNRKMGYRLLPNKITYPAQVKSGTQINIQSVWTNNAAGRLWNKYNLKYYLVDKNGKEVWSGTDTSFDPVIYVSGDEHIQDSTLKISDVKDGTYTLKTAIVDSKGKPAIKMPIAGRDSTGRYYIGQIKVSSTAKTTNESLLAREGFESGSGIKFEAAGIGKLVSSSIVPDGKFAVMAGASDKPSTGTILESKATLKLEPNTAYAVTFDYKTNISTTAMNISSNERYWFEARSAKGGASATSGQYKWRDVSNAKASRTVVVTTGNYDDYKLYFGMTGSYQIAFDNIVVRKIGSSISTSFEESTRYSGDKSQDMYFMPAKGPDDMPMEADIISDYKATGNYAMRLKNTLPNKNGVLISDTYAIQFKPNTAYTITFNTQGIGETGNGGYYYLDLRSTNNTDEVTNIANWFEREDFGVVNKTYRFITGSSGGYYLEFGCFDTAVYMVDDINIIEDESGVINLTKSAYEESRNLSREPSISTFPLKENFESGVFNGGYIYSGARAEGRMTNKAGEVISGKYSALGYTDKPGTDMWLDYINTDYKRVPLQMGKTYSVTFKYKILEAPPADNPQAYFYFMARKNGYYSEDVGLVTWKGPTGESGVKKFTVTIPSEDYFMNWGIQYGGKISVDDIIIEEVTPKTFTGTIDFEGGSFGDSFCLPGQQVGNFTKDAAKVISGKYSFYGKSTREYNEFIATDPSKVKFEPNKQYKITFDYKVIEEPYAGGYFYMFMRSAKGPGQDRGEIRFAVKAGEKKTASVTFTVGENDDYSAIFGGRWNGCVSIDNIKIEKLN